MSLQEASFFLSSFFEVRFEEKKGKGAGPFLGTAKKKPFGYMTFSFAFNVLLAGLAPVVSALVPKLIYRSGFSLKTSHILLGISAGLLFAIATVDLIPEAMEIAESNEATAKETEGSSLVASAHADAEEEGSLFFKNFERIYSYTAHNNARLK